jgi:hypothetical protein
LGFVSTGSLGREGRYSISDRTDVVLPRMDGMHADISDVVADLSLCFAMKKRRSVKKLAVDRYLAS